MSNRLVYSLIGRPCAKKILRGWNEIWCRGRLFAQGIADAGGPLSERSAAARGGNRGGAGSSGELPAASANRAQARRPSVESEGAERRLHAGAFSRANHDGRRGG